MLWALFVPSLLGLAAARILRVSAISGFLKNTIKVESCVILVELGKSATLCQRKREYSLY